MIDGTSRLHETVCYASPLSVACTHTSKKTLIV
jgi:hypothetical protein